MEGGGLVNEAEYLREKIGQALDELGVPGPEYPAPVANAVVILRQALDGSRWLAADRKAR